MKSFFSGLGARIQRRPFFVPWLVQSRNGKHVFDFIRNTIMISLVILLSNFASFYSYPPELRKVLYSADYCEVVVKSRLSYDQLVAREVREQLKLYMQGFKTRVFKPTSKDEHDAMKEVVSRVEVHLYYVQQSSTSLYFVSMAAAVTALLLAVMNMLWLGSVIWSEYKGISRMHRYRTPLVVVDRMTYYVGVASIIATVVILNFELNSRFFADGAAKDEEIAEFAKALGVNEYGRGELRLDWTTLRLWRCYDER